MVDQMHTIEYLEVHHLRWNQRQSQEQIRDYLRQYIRDRRATNKLLRTNKRMDASSEMTNTEETSKEEISAECQDLQEDNQKNAPPMSAVSPPTRRARKRPKAKYAYVKKGLRLPLVLSAELRKYVDSNGVFQHTHPLALYIYCVLHLYTRNPSPLIVIYDQPRRSFCLPVSRRLISGSELSMVHLRNTSGAWDETFNYADVFNFKMTIHDSIIRDTQSRMIRIGYEEAQEFTYGQLKDAFLPSRSRITTIELSRGTSEEIAVIVLCAAYEIRRPDYPYTINIWQIVTPVVAKMLDVLVDAGLVKELTLTSVGTEIPSLWRSRRVESLRLIDPIRLTLPTCSTSIHTIRLDDTTTNGSIISAIPHILATMPLSVRRFSMYTRAIVQPERVLYFTIHLGTLFPQSWPLPFEFQFYGGTFDGANRSLRLDFMEMLKRRHLAMTNGTFRSFLNDGIITGEMVADAIVRNLRVDTDGEAYKTVSELPTISGDTLFNIYREAVCYRSSFCLWEYVYEASRRPGRRLQANGESADLNRDEAAYTAYINCVSILALKSVPSKPQAVVVDYDPMTATLEPDDKRLKEAQDAAQQFVPVDATDARDNNDEDLIRLIEETIVD